MVLMFNYELNEFKLNIQIQLKNNFFYCLSDNAKFSYLIKY